MLLKKLLAFHEKTMERYKADMAKDRPAWMETVMKIHEQASMLFYVDDYREETGGKNCEEVILALWGEIVRGRIKKDSGLTLYNVRGEFLAKAVALEDISETGMDREAPYGKNTGRVRIRISVKNRDRVMKELSMMTED